MTNYINKKFSYQNSPQPDENWVNSLEEKRKTLIYEILIKNPKYESFEIVRAEDNGNVILRIQKIIDASERGVLLLDLEQILKNTIDQGITIWLESVGDKSKLRNLRGIKIKSDK